MAINRRTAATESTLITLGDEWAEKEEEEWIFVKLQQQNEDDNQFWYRMSRTTYLHYLMLDYTQRIGVAFNSARFLYDVSYINLFSTADHLKLDHGDIIYVVLCDKVTVKGATLSTRNFGRIGVAFNSVRFLCYERFHDVWDSISKTVSEFLPHDIDINPNKTADDLRMKDGDYHVIDVIEWDNFWVHNDATQSTLISLPRVIDEEKSVVLKVHDLVKNNHLFYCIGGNTPLHNLMLDYSERNGNLYKHMRFFYSGKFIKPNETAHDLEIDDGNVILAIDTQIEHACHL